MNLGRLLILVLGLGSVAYCQDSSLAPQTTWTKTDVAWAVLTPLAALVLLPVDEPVQRWASTSRTPLTRGLAKGVKLLGDGWFALPLAGLAAWTPLTKEHPRWAAAGSQAVYAWVFTQIPTQALKYSLHRHRPSEGTHSDVWDGPSFSQSHLSFPSGHSAGAWSVLPAVAMQYPETPWVQWVCYGLATATSLSRVHDGEHWLSDVAFSGALGYGVNRWLYARSQKDFRKVSLSPILTESGAGMVATVLF